MSAPLPPLPEELRARYRPVRLLGQGGFGLVLLAKDQDLDRPVALKLLRQALQGEELRRRFVREARVTSELSHPHIVVVYDTGVSGDGSAYIVYQYVEGEDLAARLERRGLLAPEAVAALGVALAAALQAAHEVGILHRDVKPQNVLLHGSDHPLLCDFGIAGVVGAGSESARLTAEGCILGTPGYMAPEVLRGEAATPASDQFSLAATLLVAATGANPYGAVDLEGYLEAIRGPAPTRFPETWRGRLPGLEPALTRAVDPDPARRFPSLAAFGEALAPRPRHPAPDPAAPTRVLSPPGPGPGPVTRAREATRRRRAPPAGLAALGAVAMLALLVAGGFPAARALPPPSPPPSASPPPRTPPPAPPGLREARARLIQAREAAGGPLPPAHLFYEGPPGYMKAHVEDILAEARRDEARELTESLWQWIRLARLGTSPSRQDTELLETSLAALVFLGDLHETLSQQVLQIFTLNRALRYQSRADAALEAFRVHHDHLVQRLTSLEDPPVPVRTFYSRWAYRTEQGDSRVALGWLEELLETDRGLSPEVLAALQVRQVGLLFQLAGRNEMPCQEVERHLRPLPRRLAARVSHADASLQCWIASQYLDTLDHLVRRCDGEPPLAHELAVLATATELVQRQCLAANAKQRGDVTRVTRRLREARAPRSPEERAALERLAEVVATHAAAPAAAR